MRRIALISSILTLIAAACSGTTGDGAPRIVATTTILGDITTNIVEGCGPQVTTLMPIGQDPHAFQPSANQAATLQSADLVIANGLDLEQGLDDVLAGAEREGVPVLRVAEQLDPVPFGRHASATDGAVTPGTLDPHVWLDPVRMADGVDLITTAAIDRMPDLEACLTDRGGAYRDALVATHHRIEDILSAVPDERRVLVTNHDSLGYFADRYGFRILGAVVPSGSTLAEPSPADLRELVDAMRNAGVDVIFAETTEPARLAEAVAAELGYPVDVVELYTGSLGAPGSEADTYLGLLETDARRIADALAP